MADFFLIVSDDPETLRRSCSEARRNLLRLAPDCPIDQMGGPRWSLVTSRNPVVPYAVTSDSEGAALVIGSTFDPAGPQVSDLLAPAAQGRSRAMRELCRGLNYGLAVSVRDGEVLAASDWLGSYPVYYGRSGSNFALASVPALFRCVPGFCPELDLHGLVGLLLLAHTCLGHTLDKGVSRLPHGHVLKHAIAGGETTQKEVPQANGISVPADLEEAVEAFDAVLGSVITEAVRELTPSLYLSGGLDSRIVAGYLHRAGGGTRTAVTTGDPKDLETRAAARAASTLGLAHEIVPVDQSRYPEYAQIALDRDSMTSGLYVLVEWTVAESARRPMLTGFLGDPVMGAAYVGLGEEPSCGIHSFDAMFRSSNAFGLSPGVVRELVRHPEIDDILSDVWRGLRNEYDSYSDLPWQRSWWFGLLHRQRFLIGQLQKIIALSSWPVMPYGHPSVVRLAAATPLVLLSDRKVQIELLRRKFPGLARLPLARGIDRRWYKVDRDRPPVWSRAAGRMMDSLSWHARRRINLPERRVFVRTFDFDGSGWMALRDEARARIGRLEPVLNKDLVLRLIPPSSVRAQLKRPVTDAAGRKALVGAVLYLSRAMT